MALDGVCPPCMHVDQCFNLTFRGGSVCARACVCVCVVWVCACAQVHEAKKPVTHRHTPHFLLPPSPLTPPFTIRVHHTTRAIIVCVCFVNLVCFFACVCWNALHTSCHCSIRLCSGRCG
eukprot:GDKI01013066.1.p1 GENE.GDKI01013066.1~~GDKI01013066.1.p1  ORF type:complete len:120 (+),score=19.98 GDKI01013066.1:512-871(+)